MGSPAAETKVSKTVASQVRGHRPTRVAKRGEPLLLEFSWEVCNQVGGIYTVLRSKAPCMVDHWGNRYCLVGPYNAAAAAVEFEAASMTDPVGQAVKQLQDRGIRAHYGRWLVSGRPHIVLLEHLSLFDRLDEIKYRLWQNHHIEVPANDEMLNSVIAFAEGCKELLWLVSQKELTRRPIVAHFHEWMAGAAVPMLRYDNWPGTMVFTTHATMLGRFLAMNDEHFYENLASYNAIEQARKYRVEPGHRLECAAAHGAQVFTTVSDVTAEECRHLIGRAPDLLLPNGLNIQRFSVRHELQNMHRQFKEKIHEFTIGHFFPSYSFDLEKTLYVFISGRFEHRNKGMDLTIESLAKLNCWLRDTDLGVTVVAFIITKRPTRSIDVTALQSRAMLEEFRTNVDAAKEQVGQKLFRAAAEGRIPNLDSLVDDYWQLRLRRAIQAWKREFPPGIVTHVLEDDQNDQLLNQLRSSQLWNQQDDPVKVIYHPDFIAPSNPLFRIEYDQFVRGCHMGIFPSYYEPWGYTPLESIALGVPAVTSDLSGFGSYVKQLLPDYNRLGLYVLERQKKSFQESADDLTNHLMEFCKTTRRERVALRNEVEGFSVHFDWHNLGKRYHEAHALAIDRV